MRGLDVKMTSLKAEHFLSPGHDLIMHKTGWEAQSKRNEAKTQGWYHGLKGRDSMRVDSFFLHFFFEE